MGTERSPAVADIVAQFLAARRAGRRSSIDDCLATVRDDSERARLRTMALQAIARELRVTATMPSLTGLPEDDHPAAPLPELDGYDIIDELGRGGMGVVYEAYQQSTGRRVAVKFLLDAEHSEQGRRRFEREVELGARLQHARIVSIIDSGILRGHYYYVMDYVEGRPLSEALPPGECDPREALALTATVAEVVDYAHQRGVLHRDLKPSNVLVDEHGDVHLLDFGLAKAIDPAAAARAMLSLSQPGQIVGTIAYMPPEQSRGELDRISVRSDVYALGAMAYELVTGRLPCRIDGPLADVLARLAEREPPRPSGLRRGVDGDVDAMLLKALEKRPEGRYATAGDFAADLRRYLTDRPIQARPSGPGRRVARWVRRHRGVSAVSAVALVVLAVMGGVWVSAAAAERARTERVQQFFVRNFGFASPDVAKRATVERRDLLDYAAGRVAAELAGYPRAQAQVRHALGEAYLELALYPEALAQLQQALALRREHLSPESAETADTLQLLGLAQQQLNEYDAAQASYAAALAIRRQAVGKHSGAVAQTLDHLAWLAKERGEYDAAAAQYAEALRMRRALYGDDHPEVAATLNNLAHLEYVRGDYEPAEAAFREALAIRLRQYPDRRNTHVAATMASLGSLLNKLGRYDEAGPLLGEALEIRMVVCGPEHADTLVSRNEWGLHLLETGQYAAAAEVLEENLHLRREVYGPGHQLVAVSAINLGLALQSLGELTEAEALYREALASVEALHGANAGHPHIAAVCLHLASVLCDAERGEDARPYAARAVAIREALAPDGTGAGLGQAYGALGRVELECGDLAAAQELLSRGVELLTAEVPASHWRVAQVRSDLGACLFAGGEYSAAEPLLTEAYADIAAAQGAHSRYADAARRRVVGLYEAWDRSADAEAYRALAASPQGGRQ